jgi:hypothetical protein
VTLTFPSLRIGPGDMPEGLVAIGSEHHKVLFSRTLPLTFNPYKPAVINRQKLKPKTQEIITSLPIWDIAVQTENRAGLFLASCTETVSDPLPKQAIEINAFQARRQRHVLTNLVEAYGIRLAPEPIYPKPRDPEFAFVRVGYSECIDGFFRLRPVEAARRTVFLPPELVDTFEPVVHEEGRHIVFFANWIAWYRRKVNGPISWGWSSARPN